MVGGAGLEPAASAV